MKLTLKILTMTLIASAVAGADDAFSYRNQLRLEALRLEFERARLQRDADLNAIRVAYPDNPQLYRYLQRNERYIPRYLGYGN
jgi:hypothetical protein